ncbi:MAG TPA: MgtC/SapB family protein [Gemmataceae bacterium]|nr:MgtC/SapB family protein [Gemmataceae bacterium]
MLLDITWYDIALRLALTLVAGILLGFNRSERGRSAGLCTATLVCLAASLSMIQVNLLLDMRGKAPDSFITNDLMRFPLGILTGMGFIGAGAILRRGNMIQGVTTAATLWLATVLGLCIGGGQLVLGVAGLAIGLGVLWGLKEVENNLKEDRQGTLIVVAVSEGPSDQEIRDVVRRAGFTPVTWNVVHRNKTTERQRTVRSEIHWRGHRTNDEAPGFVGELAAVPGILSVRWKT